MKGRHMEHEFRWKKNGKKKEKMENKQLENEKWKGRERKLKET